MRMTLYRSNSLRMVDGSHPLQIEKVFKRFWRRELSSCIAAELILRRDNKDCNVVNNFLKQL